MIHTKNKNGFKKTTSKVESTEIRKNILDMIKGTINAPQNGKQSPIINNQNVSNNTTKINPKKIDKAKEFTLTHYKKQKINAFEFSQLAPKICQSIHGTPKTLSKAHLHSKPEVVSNVISIQINCFSERPNRGLDAQEEYLNLLENKLKKIEQEKNQYVKQYSSIKLIHEQFVKQQQEAKVFEDHFLANFYHEARNVIINTAAQLIQWRDSLIPSSNKNKISSPSKLQQVHNYSQLQIDSVNFVLGKCQQILSVYHKTQKDKEIPLELEIREDVQFLKLQKKCKYQEKTIDLLRKELPYTLQFNEIKLLRHQINRLSDLNEKLIVRCQKLKDKGLPDKISQISPIKVNKDSPVKDNIKQSSEEAHLIGKELERMQQQNTRLGDLLQIIQLNNKKLEEEIKVMQKKLVEEEDKAYKFKQEKEVLIEFLEEEKLKNQELERKIQSLNREEDHQNLNQISFNKQNLNLDKNKNIVSAEQLCRELKPYPKHFNLFRKILTDYEQKISTLQEQICEEKTTKDKFKEWSSSVYQLLVRHSSDQITQDQIETQLQELYKVDQYIDNCRIEKLLRQIKSLSIGVDESEIGQMVEELGEYVVTLKQRNQVIKEVQYEDGSSVAYSDTFTDQDFDQ